MRTEEEHPPTPPQTRHPVVIDDEPSYITTLTTAPSGDDFSEMKRDRRNSVSISVYTNDLRGVLDGGFAKVGWLRRSLVRSWKTVDLEAADHTDSVFYAPDVIAYSSSSAPTPTHSIKVAPSDTAIGELVREGENFEISFVGMSVRPHDGSMYNNNELLLYSLTKMDNNQPNGQQQPHLMHSPISTSSEMIQAELVSRDLKKNSSSWHLPTGISPRVNDSPYIHYDPVIDGHDVGTEPNEFVPVPTSGSLYVSHDASRKNYTNCTERIPIRFTLMEIDKVSDVQARAVSGIDQLGNYVSGSAAVVPYLEVLTKAFTVASALGKHGLKKYSRPDHVLSTDMEFLIAKSKEYYEKKEDDREILYKDNYLRYGYYFFLNKPVDARLYTDTESSDRLVPLLFRQAAPPSLRCSRNELEYFAMTGRSYVVMKVTRGCRPRDEVLLKRDRENHQRRLENMLQMSQAIQMLAGMKDNNTGIRDRMMKLGRK